MNYSEYFINLTSQYLESSNATWVHKIHQALEPLIYNIVVTAYQEMGHKAWQADEFAKAVMPVITTQYDFTRGNFIPSQQSGGNRSFSATSMEIYDFFWQEPVLSRGAPYFAGGFLSDPFASTADPEDYYHAFTEDVNTTFSRVFIHPKKITDEALALLLSAFYKISNHTQYWIVGASEALQTKLDAMNIDYFIPDRIAQRQAGKSGLQPKGFAQQSGELGLEGGHRCPELNRLRLSAWKEGKSTGLTGHDSTIRNFWKQDTYFFSVDELKTLTNFCGFQAFELAHLRRDVLDPRVFAIYLGWLISFGEFYNSTTGQNLKDSHEIIRTFESLIKASEAYAPSAKETIPFFPQLVFMGGDFLGVPDEESGCTFLSRPSILHVTLSMFFMQSIMLLFKLALIKEAREFYLSKRTLRSINRSLASCKKTILEKVSLQSLNSSVQSQYITDALKFLKHLLWMTCFIVYFQLRCHSALVSAAMLSLPSAAWRFNGVEVCASGIWCVFFRIISTTHSWVCAKFDYDDFLGPEYKYFLQKELPPIELGIDTIARNIVLTVIFINSCHLDSVPGIAVISLWCMLPLLLHASFFQKQIKSDAQTVCKWAAEKFDSYISKVSFFGNSGSSSREIVPQGQERRLRLRGVV